MPDDIPNDTEGRPLQTGTYFCINRIGESNVPCLIYITREGDGLRLTPLLGRAAACQYNRHTVFERVPDGQLRGLGGALESLYAAVQPAELETHNSPTSRPPLTEVCGVLRDPHLTEEEEARLARRTATQRGSVGTPKGYRLGGRGPAREPIDDADIERYFEEEVPEPPRDPLGRTKKPQK
jgi:hypothetical protein